ncbi:putative flavin-containing amine oxidase [Sarocladium strictum]
MTRQQGAEALDLDNTKSGYYAPASISPPNTRAIHVSGQPGSAKNGHVPADYESQIHLALLNLRRILLTAGAIVRNITKLTLFIVNYDPAQRKHTKHVQRFLAGHRPAITLIPVPQLAVPSWLFEIDAVIVAPDAAASVPRPVANSSAEEVDVVVIGAGIAGLTAATEVRKAGLSCVVLEARDRVGGKMWSQNVVNGEGMVDLGAAWINDVNQTKIFKLAKKYGADILEQNTTGKCVLEDKNGVISSFEYGQLPDFDAATQRDIARIRDMVESDCQSLDLLRPQSTEYDSMTFEAYLRSRGATEDAILTASVWTRAMLGQNPSDISALYFLSYCRSGGGLLTMRSDRKGGGQHLRVRQGMQLMPLGLAKDLPGGTVRLSSPVTSIVQHENTVEVTVKDGKAFQARKVITTIPTPAIRPIAFYPPLPLAKQAWIDSTTYGYYTKAMMVFKTPFWVEKGYCGLIQSFTGPASVIRDTCSEPDKKYVLTCFMGSDAGRAWSDLSTPDREKALVAQIGKLYGAEKEAQRDFVEMVTYEWTKDEFAGWGCPCTALTPGVLDLLGGDALRAPCGNLHWAGTETAGEWKGYMEGALLSGERAAAEVVTGLTHVNSRL